VTRRKGFTILRIAAASMAFLLAACQSTVAPIKTSELCTRGKRAKPILIAHVDGRGEAFQDDAPRGEYDGVVKRVATAVAAPRTGDYVHRVRTDCYDKAKKVWYPCVKETNVKFSRIKGIVRAPKMGRARDLAIQLCEDEVRKASPKFGGFTRVESQKFRCRITQVDYCPTYKATKAQKKQKKRLREERRGARRREEAPRVDCPSGSENCMNRGRRR